MTTLFKNIKELIQVRKEQISFVSGKEMKELPTIKNAYLLVENGLIADFGSMDDCPNIKVDEIIDATGKYIIPGGIDVHVHMDLPSHVGKSSDSFLTGSKAALAGGTTSIIDFVTPSQPRRL